MNKGSGFYDNEYNSGYKDGNRQRTEDVLISFMEWADDNHDVEIECDSEYMSLGSLIEKYMEHLGKKE